MYLFGVVKLDAVAQILAEVGLAQRRVVALLAGNGLALHLTSGDHLLLESLLLFQQIQVFFVLVVFVRVDQTLVEGFAVSDALHALLRDRGAIGRSGRGFALLVNVVAAQSSGHLLLSL
jgi:hypothetical protein